MTIKQYIKWFKHDWAKAGLLISIFLFAFLFVIVKESNFVLFLILLQTPLYMLHETEEYIFPGGFARFFNLDIMKVDTADKPINEDFIFYINVVLIWITLPLFGLLASKNIQLGLWIPYFSFFAGVAHIALAIRAKKLYNSGLIVSLVLNIPVGAWSVIYLLNQGLLSNIFLNPHFFIGLGVNLLLPIIGVLKYKNYSHKLNQ